MELRHLRYFIAVAEEMNVHRAAERLNISQPPLSVAIKQLEEEVGTALFDRVGRAIEITRAGAVFLEDARKIIEASEEAKLKSFDIGQGIEGTIKIGFVSSAALETLPKIVNALRHDMPKVNIDVSQAVSGYLADEVLGGAYDLGIIRYPEHIPPELEEYRLSEEGWCIACTRDSVLAAQENVSIKDLADERLVFYPRYNNPGGYDDVMELFQEAGITPKVEQYAPEQMTILGLVRCGVGIGIVPETISKLQFPDIVFKPIRETENRTGFSLISLPKKDSLVQNVYTVICEDKGFVSE